MRDLGLKSFGQVDNLDGLEWASLDAHTATNAEVLRDKADRGVRPHIDTKLACFVKRTNLSTLLPALFRLALIRIDNCDSHLVVSHVLFGVRRRVRLLLNYSIITIEVNAAFLTAISLKHLRL